MRALVHHGFLHVARMRCRVSAVKHQRAVATTDVLVTRMNPQGINLGAATAWQLTGDPGEILRLSKSRIG